MVSTVTLSSASRTSNKFTETVVRLRPTNTSDTSSQVGLIMVDKQSTLVERRSNTTSNCRYYDNLRCFQDELGCFHGNTDDRRQVVAGGSTEHINILEPKAAFFALKSFLKDKINKMICLKLDNTTAVAYLNNMGGTHCPQLLRLTLEIWEWCEKKSVFLLAQHIPGVNNTVADVESRTTRDWNDWKLKSDVILPLITECQVDLFALRLSHQLDKYVSWRPDPNALYTDAFAISWSNMTAYAFPPFNLIHAVLGPVV